MAIKLRPVRMKNSLYLLIPKGVSELFNIKEKYDCVLTTESTENKLVLHYTFPSESARAETEPHKRKMSREAPTAPQIH